MTERTITTHTELADALRDGAAAGAIDARNDVDTAREFYNVADDLSDEEIEAALVAQFRSEHGPVLLLTLGGTVHIQSTEFGDDDAIADAARQISEIAEETITLERVPDSDRREGDFVAVRMPEGSYEANDHEIVARYGVEVGTYRQVDEDERLRRRLEIALDGVSHEEMTVEGGTCTVAFHDAPGADAGWCVEVRASERHIVATFDRDGGEREEVEVNFNGDEERQRVAFEGFLHNPASTAEDLWETVVNMREDRAA